MRSAEPARKTRAASATTGGSAIARTFAWLHGRLSGRPDSEHEQAIIRIVVICGMYAYMLLAPFPPAEREVVVFWSSLLFAAGMFASLGILGHILWQPGISPVRRVIGIVVDAAGINGAMLIGGILTTPFYPLLLWIIFGHGFRYGNRYLFTAATLSLAMFGFVVFANRDLRAHTILDVALVLSLVVLPGYVSFLLKKLTDALDRAEAASRAKSRFLATMSHEFRTPLNAILGTTQTLGVAAGEAERRDAVATIETAARSLLAMVDAMLRLARIESGRLQLEHGPVDLDALTVRMMAMVRPGAAAKGLDLRRRIDPQVPSVIHASEEGLEHVLLNLLANAVKFTSAGHVLLRLGTVRDPLHGERLRIEVRDTGIGIPEEARQRIFERFVQADEETRVRFGGTGLGLAIARELVELMDGTIGVESRVGRGSTFYVELPLVAADEVSTAELPEGGIVVLGNALVSLTVAERIEALGLAARIAASPASAVEGLHRLEGRRAVVAIPPTQPAELDELATRIATSFPGEAIEIVALGIDGIGEDARVLAALPAGADDRMLLRALRGALQAPPARQLAGSPASAPVARAAKVLLAEDNRVNQKVISRLLEQIGHEVEVVDNGQAVIDRLADQHFDLVVLDVNMPDMSGQEVVKLLRFLHDPAELPPIVALSADVTPETREECLSLGFSRYLTKPVNREALARAIEELVPDARRTGIRRADAQPDSGAPPMTSPDGSQDGKIIPHPALARLEGDGVLDSRRLRQIAQLDPDAGFVESLVRDFLDDGEALVSELLAAAEKGDAKAWRAAVHALKSSAAHIGAKALWTRTREWRNVDDHALLMRARAESQAIAEEFARARDALQRYLRSRAS